MIQKDIDRNYSTIIKNSSQIISDYESEIRLDKFIKMHNANITQGIIEKLLRNKKILLNNNKAKSSDRVKKGDIVFLNCNIFANKAEFTGEGKANNRLINSQSNESSLFYPKLKLLEKLLNKVVYINEYCIIINKPADLSSQGGLGVKISIDCCLKVFNNLYQTYRNNRCCDLYNNSSKDTQNEKADFEIATETVAETAAETAAEIAKIRQNYPKIFNFMEDLQAYCNESQGKKASNKDICLKLVHRLDTDTTGAFIIAKNYDGAVFLSYLLKNHMIHKYYFAILTNAPDFFLDLDREIYQGNPDFCGARDEFCTKNPNSARDELDAESSRHFCTVKTKDGEKTEMLFVQSHNLTLAAFKLISGKKHQIRRHCLFLNAPILFDKKYNFNEFNNNELENYFKDYTFQRISKPEWRFEGRNIVDFVTKKIMNFKWNTEKANKMKLHSAIVMLPKFLKNIEEYEMICVD